MHDKIAALSLTDADRDPTGFADKLGRSFGDSGFGIVADHGIAQALIDREIGRAEAVRDEVGDAVGLDCFAIARGAQDFDVAARQLRHLEDRLAASSAGSDGGVAGQRGRRVIGRS